MLDRVTLMQRSEKELSLDMGINVTSPSLSHSIQGLEGMRFHLFGISTDDTNITVSFIIKTTVLFKIKPMFCFL